MFYDYLPVLVMVVFAVAASVIFLKLAKWLGAKRTTKMKETIYESGLMPFGDARQQISVKYYMIAVSFIIFDIEVVFLYPWAVQLTELSRDGFFAMMIFIFVLFIGWLWEYKKGGLEWD